MSKSLSRALVFSLLAAAPLLAQDVQGLAQPFKTVIVSSPVLQEVIEKLLVEEGDSVAFEQPIVQLRNEREQLELQLFEQSVVLAEFTAQGHRRLASDNMGSKEQALKSETELKLTKIRLEQAKVALKEKTIRSPLAGIVVKKHKESGESVDRAEKILEIVNIDQLNVQFYLDPKFLQLVHDDQPIAVRFPEMKGASITGKISFIDPRIDASSGLFRVKVLIENADRKVKAGMKATADFSKKAG